MRTGPSSDGPVCFSRPIIRGEKRLWQPASRIRHESGKATGRRKRSCTKARRHERGKSVPPDGRVESREKNAGNHGSEPSAVHPQSYGFRLPAGIASRATSGSERHSAFPLIVGTAISEQAAGIFMASSEKKHGESLSLPHNRLAYARYATTYPARRLARAVADRRGHRPSRLALYRAGKRVGRDAGSGAPSPRMARMACRVARGSPCRGNVLSAVRSAGPAKRKAYRRQPRRADTPR